MEPDPLQTFPLNDRIANYGDGIFTTMAVHDGHVALLERHLARLRRDSKLLGMNADEASLRAQICAQAKLLGAGTLKLLISAGQGGRGYQRDANSGISLYFSQHPLPEHYATWRTEGIDIAVSQICLGAQPMLAGIKHCNRLEQVLVKHHLPSHVDDVLVCDYQQCVVEASAANVFWIAEGQWFTPSLKQCGVAGVMREFLLDWLDQQGVHVDIVQVSPTVLTEASSLFLTNALMQIVPVRSLDYQGTHYFSVAQVLSLQNEIKSAYQDECNAV